MLDGCEMSFYYVKYCCKCTQLKEETHFSWKVEGGRLAMELAFQPMPRRVWALTWHLQNYEKRCKPWKVWEWGFVDWVYVFEQLPGTLRLQMVNAIMAEDPRKENGKGWCTLNLISDYFSQDFETFVLTALRALVSQELIRGRRAVLSSNEKSQYGGSNQLWGRLKSIWILYVP